MENSNDTKTPTLEELAKKYDFPLDATGKLSYEQIKALHSLHRATQTNATTIRELSNTHTEDARMMEFITAKRRELANHDFEVNNDISKEYMYDSLTPKPMTLQEIVKVYDKDRNLTLKDISNLFFKHNNRPIKEITVLKQFPEYNAHRYKREPEMEI